jgi:hypothetical protein
MEMLQRIKELVSRLRLISGPFSAQPLVELVALDTAITEIEHDLAATIDAQMDGRYRRHNVQPPERDEQGLSGRWNRPHVVERNAERHRLEQAQLLERIHPV